MQTIRYSESFDCLIMEREGGRLYYFKRENLPRLVDVLRHFAREDRLLGDMADRGLEQTESAERLAFLRNSWLAVQPPAPGAEVGLDLGDLGL